MKKTIKSIYEDMLGWEWAGQISVDAGICWIGDPCYILHQNPPPKDVGKDWPEFCDKLDKKMIDGIAQFKHDGGLEALGVVSTAGLGDGLYDVFVKRKKNRIAEMKVVFVDWKWDLLS